MDWFVCYITENKLEKIMSKIVEIKVPVKSKQGTKIITAEGKVAWFQIGEQRIKFLIQDCGLSGVQLTHFASGFTVANRTTIAAKKVALWKSTANGCTTDREACRKCLEDLEKRVGLSEMLTKFASAEVINK